MRISADDFFFVFVFSYIYFNLMTHRTANFIIVFFFRKDYL